MSGWAARIVSMPRQIIGERFVGSIFSSGLPSLYRLRYGFGVFDSRPVKTVAVNG